MIDVLREGNSYETLKRKAQDRAGWRSWTPRTCMPSGRALLIDNALNINITGINFNTMIVRLKFTR